MTYRKLYIFFTKFENLALKLMIGDDLYSGEFDVSFQKGKTGFLTDFVCILPFLLLVLPPYPLLQAKMTQLTASAQAVRLPPA